MRCRRGPGAGRPVVRALVVDHPSPRERVEGGPVLLGASYNPVRFSFQRRLLSVQSRAGFGERLAAFFFLSMRPGGPAGAIHRRFFLTFSKNKIKTRERGEGGLARGLLLLLGCNIPNLGVSLSPAFPFLSFPLFSFFFFFFLFCLFLLRREGAGSVLFCPSSCLTRRVARVSIYATRNIYARKYGTHRVCSFFCVGSLPLRPWRERYEKEKRKQERKFRGGE